MKRHATDLDGVATLIIASTIMLGLKTGGIADIPFWVVTLPLWIIPFFAGCVFLLVGLMFLLVFAKHYLQSKKGFK